MIIYNVQTQVCRKENPFEAHRYVYIQVNTIN